ncbi:transposase [Streptomyces nigra]|uniref:transposase n=1 Tax=Streptomyces nigra TaxID=1827580 RepID=UPI0034530FB2
MGFPRDPWANGRRSKVNIMSAVASHGLWFCVFFGRYSATAFCAFPDRLARQAWRKVYVIADRHPVCHSKAVRARLAENAGLQPMPLAVAPSSIPTSCSTPT